MGASRTSFEKLQRDRAKKAKADAKRAKRQGRPVAGTERNASSTRETPPSSSPVSSTGQIGPNELLIMVEQLQGRRARKEITEEEFEELKKDLLARLA